MEKGTARGGKAGNGGCQEEGRGGGAENAGGKRRKVMLRDDRKDPRRKGRTRGGRPASSAMFAFPSPSLARFCLQSVDRRQHVSAASAASVRQTGRDGGPDRGPAASAGTPGGPRPSWTLRFPCPRAPSTPQGAPAPLPAGGRRSPGSRAARNATGRRAAQSGRSRWARAAKGAGGSEARKTEKETTPVGRVRRAHAARTEEAPEPRGRRGPGPRPAGGDWPGHRLHLRGRRGRPARGCSLASGRGPRLTPRSPEGRSAGPGRRVSLGRTSQARGPGRVPRAGLARAGPGAAAREAARDARLRGAVSRDFRCGRRRRAPAALSYGATLRGSRNRFSRPRPRTCLVSVELFVGLPRECQTRPGCIFFVLPPFSSRALDIVLHSKFLLENDGSPASALRSLGALHPQPRLLPGRARLEDAGRRGSASGRRPSGQAPRGHKCGVAAAGKAPRPHPSSCRVPNSAAPRAGLRPPSRGLSSFLLPRGGVA